MSSGRESAAETPTNGASPGEFSRLLQELARAPEAHTGASWDATLRAGAVIGRFELIREVGRGGFGVVWEARDRELGRVVAFKAIRAGRNRAILEQRLLEEAEAAARLSHPNIVTLHDVGRTERGPYLILELLQGETLAVRLERGPLPVKEALDVATSVARALAHAHARAVIHRDLTPGNVFLCNDGQVKVLDLGMAHAFGRKKLDGGTPAYMAPEQRRGAPEDERTDVFALGVVLYQMLAGETPFPALNTGEAPRREAAPLDIAGAPWLGALVTRMLAVDPVDRPRDGADVLAALEDAGRSGADTLPARPSSASPALRRRRLPRRAVIAGATALAVTAAAVVLAARHLSLALPVATPSVAVLPFADMSPKHDEEYFADGVAEEILNTLAQVDGLKVIGRTSSFSFKGKNEDLRTIGQKLDVGALLEGSVRKEGARLRITAQLVRTDDGAHVWSQVFDRDESGIFSVQEEIARNVVEALKVKLLARETPTRKWTQTGNPEVYDQYLLGQQFIRRGSLEDFRRARVAYEKSLALDSGYAPAWAGLSLAITLIELSSGPHEKEKERAQAAAERAVALAPELPEGYYARALERWLLSWDREGALGDFNRALVLNPNYGWAESTRAQLLASLGRQQEALVAAQRGIQLEPLDAWSWWHLAYVYEEADKLELERQALTRALEISPEHEYALRSLARNRIRAGLPTEALYAIQRLLSGPRRLYLEALAQHSLGNRQGSQAALDQLVESHAHDWAYQIATVFAWRGESDLAFDWLERAYVQRDEGLRQTATDPFLKGLHEDPRWRPFVEKLNR